MPVRAHELLEQVVRKRTHVTVACGFTPLSKRWLLSYFHKITSRMRLADGGRKTCFFLTVRGSWRTQSNYQYITGYDAELCAGQVLDAGTAAGRLQQHGGATTASAGHAAQPPFVNSQLAAQVAAVTSCAFASDKLGAALAHSTSCPRGGTVGSVRRRALLQALAPFPEFHNSPRECSLPTAALIRRHRAYPRHEVECATAEHSLSLAG